MFTFIAGIFSFIANWNTHSNIFYFLLFIGIIFIIIDIKNYSIKNIFQKGVFFFIMITIFIQFFYNVYNLTNQKVIEPKVEVSVVQDDVKQKTNNSSNREELTKEQIKEMTACQVLELNNKRAICIKDSGNYEDEETIYSEKFDKCLTKHVYKYIKETSVSEKTYEYARRSIHIDCENEKEENALLNEFN